ncbi:MAG: Porphobilinogen deaminase [Myxococcota bacterium]|nr:Porphobilinogen deaminase [Myxococcota bacterium]
MRDPLIIGSRGSDLALWQARSVASALQSQLGLRAGLQIIKTQGDQIDHLPLNKLEGKGFFTKELEEALLAGRVDIAVHSLKDLPVEQPPGLVIAAIPERHDPGELLLFRPDVFDPANPWLPIRAGSRVATSSPRREEQLKEMGFACTGMRGNVPTRIRKLRDGAADALLLAVAGVERLGLNLCGLGAANASAGPGSVSGGVIPAPGQGALAIQIRQSDGALFKALQGLDHMETRLCVTAERLLLSRLGGGCHLPLGARIRPGAGAWTAQAAVYTAGLSGRCAFTTNANWPRRAEEAGVDRAAAELADEMEHQLRNKAGPLSAPDPASSRQTVLMAGESLPAEEVFRRFHQGACVVWRASVDPWPFGEAFFDEALAADAQAADIIRAHARRVRVA